MITAKQLSEAYISGANNIENNRQKVDALNVFPVPDGDTGTNMSMTMQRAVAEIRQVKSDSVEELASALSSVGSNRRKRNAVHKRNIKVNVDALILKNRNLNAAFNVFSANELKQCIARRLAVHCNNPVVFACGKACNACERLPDSERFWLYAN